MHNAREQSRRRPVSQSIKSGDGPGGLAASQVVSVRKRRFTRAAR